MYDPHKYSIWYYIKMAVTFSNAYTCFNDEILCTLIKVGFCRVALKFGQGTCVIFNEKWLRENIYYIF